MTTITVTDHNTQNTIALDHDQFAATISPNFPEAPQEVEYAIEELADYVEAENWGPRVIELGKYLGLTINPNPELTARLGAVNLKSDAGHYYDEVLVLADGEQVDVVMVDSTEGPSQYNKALAAAGYGAAEWEA